MKILGIETSCDETAAAVVENGRTILSQVIRTQEALHGRYGGVVPELASRCHVEVIVPVVDQALAAAGLTVEDLDGLAVTQGPGLIGAVLVGLNMAKAISLATGLPLAGVNHVLAHAAAGFLERDLPEFPMVVSGGHTNLYVADGPLAFRQIGQTLDDAAGEAYDKIAKWLGLGYPGGRVIDELAARGDPHRFDLPRPMLGRGLNFSFSGLKTAVIQLVKSEFESGPMRSQDAADLAASFQAAVVDVLTKKLADMLNIHRVKGLILAGGVAANSSLRQKAAQTAAEAGVEFILPPAYLCTDNGAMIAGLGYFLLQENQRIDLTADAYSRWPAAV
jgi:N6-L-threonylcarbamoyladenine synthase